MIEIDEPIDWQFHQLRALEEDLASNAATTPSERAMHQEMAALHRLALQRCRPVR